MLKLFATLALVWTAYGQFSTVSPQDQQCLTSAFEQYLRNMSANTDMLEYAALSSSSRHFFSAIWDKPITASQWRRFCQDFVKAIRGMEACNDSFAKTTYFSQLGLARYICKNRSEDFAVHAPCLQNAYPEAKAACANRCAEFENGSRTFIEPASAAGRDMKPYMAADCQYLKCSADCHRPIFERKCPAAAANLELDALYNMADGMRDAYEPPELRSQLQFLQALQGEDALPFPPPCRKLADAAKNQTATD